MSTLLLAVLLWSADLTGCPRPATAYTVGALEPPCAVQAAPSMPVGVRLERI